MYLLMAAAYVYDYFIKDHLGSIRVVLTEQTDFTQYLATMEPEKAQTEDALFYNLNSTREPKPVDYPPQADNITTPNKAVAKLNGKDPDKRIGPSIILKVMAGDTIQAVVRAYYKKQVTPKKKAAVPAEQMLAGLVQAFIAPAMQTAATHNARLAPNTQTTNPGLTANDLQQLKNKDPQNNKLEKPKAYLNYVFFDNQFNFVSDGSGVKRVDGEPGELETLSSGKVVAKKNGYVYVYTSNESQQDVLFDNLGVMDITGPVLEETHYYPFGLTMTGISTTAPLKLENRFKYNGKELQHKGFSDGSGLEWYDYGARMYDAQIGRWHVVDPKATDAPSRSPYAFCFDNPILLFYPDGAWPIYSKSGAYLGDDGRYEKGKDLAFTGTAIRDKQGNITGYENLSQFTDNHTQFQVISNIVNLEGVTNDAKEYLWIAHTANNSANESGVSLYSKLMSGYSSVPKSDKTALSISDNSTTAKFARAGVIDVMLGGADPTDGATLWDGTDFLSWGLKSPNGTPQNKFKEYKSISISGDIFNSFLNSNLSKYKSGKVRYYGKYYDIPARVFTNKANWPKAGNFFYDTGKKRNYGLKATGTAGLSIFWKKVK